MSKPNTQEQRPSDDLQEITDLVAGQLGSFAAWRLRRKINASPVLAKELAESEALFGELRSLQAETVARPTPEWASLSTDTAKPITRHRPFLIFGGVTINRRAVIVATASLCLLCVTGVYAGVRYLYDPFVDMDAGRGLTWDAEHNFRGEVKFYDANGIYKGSHGTDGVDDAPVSAKVTLIGEKFTVSGAGRHEIRDKQNRFLGIVELIPEREAFWKRHNQEMGTEQRLSISYGARDGYGQCIGFFGDGPNRVTWKLSGSNVRVLFFDEATGKQVYSGTAFPLNDTIRAEMKQTLSPESYAATVSAGPIPSDPRFSWTTPDGRQHAFMTFRSYPMTLRDGTKMRVQIVPRTPK